MQKHSSVDVAVVQPVQVDNNPFIFFWILLRVFKKNSRVGIVLFSNFMNVPKHVIFGEKMS